MGKLRKYSGYITVSCSGPSEPSVARSRLVTIRSRAGADLRYTTADADFLYRHFSSRHYDAQPEDLHIRLVNPKRKDLLDAVAAMSYRLNAFRGKPHWSGGCIHLIYAGHGREGDGALVFPDGELTAQEYLACVANYAPPSETRTRLDLCLDSCFSGAFINELLNEAASRYKSSVSPCSLFAAASHDEFAWELPKYGHGIWTYAFMQELRKPSLCQRRPALLARVLIRRLLGLERRELHSGGVSFMTAGRQHSCFYENGTFMVDGAGLMNNSP